MISKLIKRAARAVRVAGISRCVPTDWFALPGFLIIGAQKAGTTSLHRYLVNHPRLLPGRRKEVHFFDRRHAKGPRWYRAHFHTRREANRILGDHGHEAISFEASPYYIFHPLVPERVHAMMPDVKLIALLRDPVKRAYSHYHHARRRGNEPLGLAEAIREEDERLRGEVERMRAEPGYRSFGHEHQSYLARGRYVEQLEAWHRFFPRDRLMVICSESFYADPTQTLTEVCEFLSIEPVDWSTGSGTLRTYNKGSYPPMPDDVRQELREYFRPHNRRLYDYVGRDFGWDD